MKKMISKCNLIFSILFFALSLSACVFNLFPSGEHRHKYESEYSYNQNYHYHKCEDSSCNTVDDMIAHTYDEEIIKEATCEVAGITKYSCKICGYYYESEVTVKHDLYLVNEKEATCEEDGHKSHYRCKNCDVIALDSKGNTTTTIEKVTYEKLGHDFENAIVTVTEQSQQEDGQLKIKCSKCEKVETITIPSLNQIDYYDVETIDATCEKEGTSSYSLKENYLKEQLTLKLGSVTLYDNIKNSVNKTITIPVISHEYELDINFPTMKYAGDFSLRCKNCGKIKADALGYETIYGLGKYNSFNEFINEISNEATCLTEGEVKYTLDKNYIITNLMSKYDLTEKQATDYADSFDSYEYSFTELDREHHYEEVLLLDSQERYFTYSLECKYHRDTWLYHNTYGLIFSSFDVNKSEIAPSIEIATFCDKVGYKNIILNKDEIYAIIKKDLALSDYEMNKYVKFLDESNIYSIPLDPIGHQFGEGSFSLVCPNDVQDGYMQINCIRENCGKIIKTLDNQDQVILPKFDETIEGYEIIEKNLYCLEKGNLTFEIDKDYIYKLIDENYGGSYKYNVSNLISDWDISNGFELLPIGHKISHAGSYYVVSEQIGYKCENCKEILVKITPHEFDANLCDVTYHEGNCVSKAYSVYQLKLEYAIDIVDDYPLLVNDYYGIELYARSYRGETAYYEYYELDPSNHVPETNYHDYEGDLYKDVVASYDLATNKMTNGVYYVECPCKNVIEKKTYSYSDGKWFYYEYGGYYKKTFNNSGISTSHIGPSRSSFSIKVSLNGGNTSAVTEATYNEESTAHYYTLNRGKFSKGSLICKDIIIYVDGVEISNEELISKGRLEYVYTAGRVTGYKIYLWKDKNGNHIAGDVYVVPIYDE